MTIIGSSNKKFLSRMGSESNAGRDEAGDRVRKMGSEKMALVSGDVVDEEVERLRRGKLGSNEDAGKGNNNKKKKHHRHRHHHHQINDGSDSSSSSDSDSSSSSSDSDGDDEEIFKQTDEDDATLTPTQLEERKRSAEKEADSLKLLDNDWDTSGWTLPEIESATSTLISEIETTDSEKRRALSLKMIGRILDRHKEAVNYINKVSESILNKALPNILTGGIHPHALNLSHLLAFIGPRFADEFSVLGPIGRICKIMTYEMDLATRLLQWRYKCRRLRRELVTNLDDFPAETITRKRLMLNMKSDDLNKKWREMHSSSHSTALPKEVQHSYLKILLALTTKANTEYFDSNRVQVARNHGLLPISLIMKSCDDPAVTSIGMHNTACKLALQLASKRSLLFPILRTRVQEGLEKIIRSHHNLPPADVCLALDVVDTIGYNSLKSSNNNMNEDDYEQQRLNRQAENFHRREDLMTGDDNDTDSDCPSDMEDEGEKDYYRRITRATIKDLLVTPTFVQSLTDLLHVEQNQIFLGAVMTIHKLACTQGYNVVLIEMIALAGKALSQIIENLHNQHQTIPFACLALLQQLATRQSGRDGMVTCKAVTMLYPFVTGKEATHSRVFTLALSALVSLAHDGNLDVIEIDPNKTSPRDDLYITLIQMLTKPNPSPLVSTEHLLKINALEYIINFLVRPNAPSPHFFDLPKQHQHMGAMILHRLTLHRESCKILGASKHVLNYFCHTINVNFTLMIEKNYGNNEAEKVLFFSSTQSSCRGLAQIANYTNGGKQNVFARINEHNIYKEIEVLLGFPSVRLDDTFASKLECTDAAATLLAGIARTPLSDSYADTEFESKITVKEDVEDVLPVLRRLLSQMAKPLMNIVNGCANPDAVSNACVALAFLGSTNETSESLLDMGVDRIVESLFPSKPAILEGGGKGIDSNILKNNSAAGDGKGAYDVDGQKKHDEEIVKLISLDNSVFMLIASLSRTDRGKRSMQSKALLRRCVERFHLSSGKPRTDIVVRGEIALIFARMATFHTIDSGSAGSVLDYLCAPSFNTVNMLLELVSEGGEFGGRARYNSALALAEMSSDLMRVVPAVVGGGGVQVMGKIVKEYVRGGKGGAMLGLGSKVPLTLLRPVLMCLKKIVKYPMGAYVKKLIDFDMQQPLVAIGSNVKLQMEYVGVKDRETLGDIARDILFALTEGKAQQDKLAAALGPRVDLQGPEVSHSEGGREDEEKKGEDEIKVGGGYLDQQAEFVNKMLTNLEEKGIGTFDGTYSSMGVSKVGSLAADLPDEETTHKTKLTGLDAESEGFRRELKKRKDHYKGGASRKKIEQTEKKEMLTSKSSGSIITKIEEVKKTRGDTSLEAAPSSPTILISEVADLKMTRPPGPKPAQLATPTNKSTPKKSILDDKERQAQMSALTIQNDGPKNFVTFVRPKESLGLFIDPTFVDDTPVMESTLTTFGNDIGPPRMLSSNSIITADMDSENVETFGHKVEIMGNLVTVKGKRVRGKNVTSMIDSKGKTKKAVTFDNVHDAATSRSLAKFAPKK